MAARWRQRLNTTIHTIKPAATAVSAHSDPVPACPPPWWAGVPVDGVRDARQPVSAEPDDLTEHGGIGPLCHPSCP